jgi:hypothetical protein
MCTEMPRTVALRDVIFQIVQVARERADVANTVLGERLIEQLDRAVLTIVFAGQYSRGKTSLINALVGMDLLPTGILPATMVSTVVAGGPVAAAHVVYVDEPDHGTRQLRKRALLRCHAVAQRYSVVRAMRASVLSVHLHRIALALDARALTSDAGHFAWTICFGDKGA